jgi:hypothetical protein
MAYLIMLADDQSTEERLCRNPPEGKRNNERPNDESALGTRARRLKKAKI